MNIRPRAPRPWLSPTRLSSMSSRSPAAYWQARQCALEAAMGPSAGLWKSLQATWKLHKAETEKGEAIRAQVL